VPPLMLKSRSLGVLLVALLVLTTLGTSVLTYRYIQTARQLQRRQGEVAVINRNQAALQALVAESVDYAKRQPALESILLSVGVRPRGTNVGSGSAAAAP
jgi:hypothetical protein